MDLLIDSINLIFAFVGIYFSILFILLFFAHEKKLFKRPKMADFPSISIIIPVHNEEGIIDKTVNAVKRMSYPKSKEIIVVDDGSTDRTFDVARKISGIRLFRKRQGGKASALNFGIRKAKGEIVACMDADSYPEKSALLKSMPFFEDGVGAVTTSVFVKNTNCILERVQEIEYAMVSWSRKMFEFINAIYVTPGPLSLYRKDVLIKIGGFDEKNMTEDIEIAWRFIKNNYKIKMAFDATTYTNVPKTFRKWWYQRVRWNIGGMQTSIKYSGLFLKKGFGNIGTFLLPLFTVSYFLSLIGILFITYSFFNFARYVTASIVFGFNPIGAFLLAFNPDIFVALVLMNFALLTVFLRLNFKTLKSLGQAPRSVLDLLLFIFVYMCVFPLNLLHSTIKFALGKYEW
ncbi:MAG: glycosyltransferase [Candidatus Aenigmatarchaeota archaeon]